MSFNWRLALGDIERKVKAQATAGTLTAIAVFFLGRYVYDGQIPAYATEIIDVGAPVIAGLISSWVAKHTIRPGVVGVVAGQPGVLAVDAVGQIVGPKSLADPATPGDHS